MLFGQALISLVVFIVGAWILKLMIGRRKQLKIESEKDVSIVNTIGCLTFIFVFIGFFVVNNLPKLR